MVRDEIEFDPAVLVHDVYFLYDRKQDCSPEESAAIAEEVRGLEVLLNQVRGFPSSQTVRLFFDKCLPEATHV